MKTPQMHNEEVAAAWRGALWILEALPAARRPVDLPSSAPLRSRKLVTLVDRLWNAEPTASRALGVQIVPGVPFDQAIRWWVDRHNVPSATLYHLHAARSMAGSRLIALTGSIPAAHSLLLAAARTKVTDRDTCFSESEIRAQIVRDLLQTHKCSCKA